MRFDRVLHYSGTALARNVGMHTCCECQLAGLGPLQLNPHTLATLVRCEPTDGIRTRSLSRVIADKLRKPCNIHCEALTQVQIALNSGGFLASKAQDCNRLGKSSINVVTTTSL